MIDSVKLLPNYSRNGIFWVFTALDASEWVLEDTKESCNTFPSIINKLSISISNTRTKSFKFFLSNFLLAFDFFKNLRHLSFNLLIENTRKLFCQWLGSPKIRRKCWVNRTGCKIFLLWFNTFFYRYIIVHIFLASIFNSNISVSKRDLLIFKNISRIISTIHNIDFGEATDWSLTRWIYFSHDLQSFTCSEILIGRDHTKNDRSWLIDIS